MKNIKLEDLKVLETYLNHAIKELHWWTEPEAIGYIADALAEIKRWKDEREN